MTPWDLLATAAAPGGGGLRLLRRGPEFSIRLQDGNELMNSRLGGSEEALARLALRELPGGAAPRILIGGLGMGFTLRAALALAPERASLVVAEILPELVEWADRHMAEVFGDCLGDPRVRVQVADVAALIRQGSSDHDAILLDVDNGPGGLTRPGNDALYAEAGLTAARRALAPGGVLAVWSASPDAGFTRRLQRCGFMARAHPVRAGHSGRGARHVIWIARRPVA